MKTALIALLVLCSLLSFAQNTTTDTSATCIAFWQKGERKTFQITRIKENIADGKPKSKTALSYEAHVQVVDSTEEGYKLQWQYKNFSSEDNPAASMAGMLMEELKINYTTTTAGAFKDLTNWEEVRDFYVGTMELSFKDQKDDTAKAIKNKVLAMFQTKDQVEALLIKEVQLYHMPFGFEYAKGENKGETELDNIFGGAPFPAIQTIRLPRIDPATNSYTLFMDTELDKGNFAHMAQDVLKKLLPFPVSSEEEIRQAFAELQMKESSEFRVTLSTGWLSKVFYKKEGKSGSNVQSESYLIEEK